MKIRYLPPLFLCALAFVPLVHAVQYTIAANYTFSGDASPWGCTTILGTASCGNGIASFSATSSSSQTLVNGYAIQCWYYNRTQSCPADSQGATWGIMVPGAWYSLPTTVTLKRTFDQNNGGWMHIGWDLTIFWSGPVGPCNADRMELQVDLSDSGSRNDYGCDHNNGPIEYGVGFTGASVPVDGQWHTVGFDMGYYIDRALCGPIVIGNTCSWSLPNGFLTGGMIGLEDGLGYSESVQFSYAFLGAQTTCQTHCPTGPGA